MQLNPMHPVLPSRILRRLPFLRGLTSKLGSLLLLFQRSPLVQMLFPEAKLLGGAGMGEAMKWTVRTVAGLGTFDSVAGATEISQVIPDQGAGEINAIAGRFLNVLVQVTGTPSDDEVSWSVDGLPAGLNQIDQGDVSTHLISGTPQEAGQTTVTVTAWQFPNQTGESFSREFLFIVAPPIIATQPASVAIPENTTTTLSVTGNPNESTLTYRWYRGNSGNTSNPVTGSAGSADTFTTPVLNSSNTPASYWVRVTRDGVSQDSNTATVTIASPPGITSQPASTTIVTGSSASLSIGTSGTVTSIQWYQGDSGDTSNPVSGAITASFNTPALTATTRYWARVANTSGFTDSSTAVVTVAENIVAPVITQQPASVTIDSGGTATLSVTASGTTPAFQWYIGLTGDTSLPVPGAFSASFTTPALSTTTRYWVRASNSAGDADSDAALVTVNPPPPPGAGPFKLGEAVTVDLNGLKEGSQTLKLVGKLPKGLKFSATTGRITGTVGGTTGTYPLKVQVFQGKTLVETIDYPIVIAGSLFFEGRYEALLEVAAGIPAGVLKITFKKGNAWQATLQSPGAKARKASGKLVVTPGTTAGTVSAAFPASGSAPAVALTATLDLESPTFSGTYNAGTLRGFRMARGSELPASGTPLGLVFETGPHDGITLPGGLGWAGGVIGPAGTATFSGVLGDGTAIELPLQLSASGQAILWSQPNADPRSYFGGIVTLPDLGQTVAGSPPLEPNVWWFKAADARSPSYPAGFPAMEVSVGGSRWTVPASAAALGASLGWENGSDASVEIDGAGLSNAAPQSTNPVLPTGFALDASFQLNAPVAPSIVPWTGKVNPADGTFSGSFALPAGLAPDGIAGGAATSGILLQSDAWGTITGCGLIKVPVAGPKGSFRTAAIVLRQ